MKQSIAILARLAVLAGILGACSGCALVSPVQPWEKGTLARPAMLLEGDGLETRFDEHVYSSREAASGGGGVGGGGCGCN